MYEFYNPNPAGRLVGDCSVRAISKALNVSWEQAYTMIAVNGYDMCDMPSSDAVWGALLRREGFYRSAIPNDCPERYTTEQFCKDHPKGTFVLGFGGHTATVVDGCLFDSWNSLAEIPQYFWCKKEDD